ncbi:MAG: orotidine-5'-phosphate decarboxylase [Bacillati bacterium ANGP1]|uniref:Orotidine 5'-phosphate decarboxylase n=1 Tax=Candidatus Segetimicrobium genomatis TaxID=2569760 RepID=A0A537JHV2_9BACT|nr:MAG: orotidine-5'-phosphate decarboxylase [Terrabacteria group bacterium ANGP1]
MDPRVRLVVALDVPSLEEAQAMAARLAGVVRWYKVGLELYTAAGPAAVAAVRKDGRVFLDLKFHDIPATVAGAVAAATRLGVDLLTVHALGGTAMLLAAAEAALRTAEIIRRRPPTVLGVTLLTSGDAAAMAEVGMAGTPAEAAVRLARLARAAGLGGVVASPADAAAIRTACGPDLLIVCPGIRPAGAAADDQRRVATPRAAIDAGADVLVVGRPITRAADPRSAAEELTREIALLTSFDTPRRSVL